MYVHPAEKRFFAKPRKLSFRIATGCLLKCQDKMIPIFLALRRIQKLQTLPVSNSMRCRGVFAKSFFFQCAHFLDKTISYHLITPHLNPGIKNLRWHIDKPATEIVMFR